MKRKKIYSVSAKHKTHIKIWKWLEDSPARNPKDDIEIDIKSRFDNHRYFLQDWEALHIACGLFLALIEDLEKLEDSKRLIVKSMV